jgi:hypothetical protein
LKKPDPAYEHEDLSIPCRWALKHGHIPVQPCKILDYGCGRGIDVQGLTSLGHDVIGYDPRFFPHSPLGLFDRVLLVYVLGALLPKERKNALREAFLHVHPGGALIVACRTRFGVAQEAKVGGWKPEADGWTAPGGAFRCWHNPAKLQWEILDMLGGNLEDHGLTVGQTDDFVWAFLEAVLPQMR